MIVKFTASNFEGYNGKSIMVHKDFVPYLNQMNELAVLNDFQVIVTSSFRTSSKVPGAIVPPAKMSNHMVGFAIDMNLKDRKSGTWYNSTKLGDGKGLDEKFLNEVVAKTGMRWGAAFNVPDSVHLDLEINKFPKHWQQIYDEVNE